MHVAYLANGHIKNLDKLNTNCRLVTYKLVIGNGYSVLNIVTAFGEAIGNIVNMA